MTQTLYEQLGGESKLRAIIDRFVERVTEDIMIGFFLRNFDKDRLRQMEFEHAAEFLGAPIRYSGRTLDAAHRRHRIAGGQFARRRQILKEVLDAENVAPAIRDAWLAHVDSLRPLITEEVDNTCHGRTPTQK